MSRGYTAESIANLNESYKLISFGFSTELNYTTCPRKVVFDGKNWLSSANITGIPKTVETLAIRPNTANVGMAGSQLANQALTLTESFNGADVKSYRYIPATGQVVLEWEGYIQTYTTSENHGSGKSDISWKCASLDTKLKAVNGRILTSEYQQRTYPTDTGLDYIGLTDNVLETWLETPASSSSGFLDFVGDGIQTIADAVHESAIHSSIIGSHGLTSIDAKIRNNSSTIREQKAEAFYNLHKAPSKPLRLPVCYGDCRVRGITAFRSLHTSKLQADRMYVLYFLSEGEIDGLTGVKVAFEENGEEVAYNAGKYSGNCAIVGEYVGTVAGDYCSALNTANSKWASTSLLNGIAYVVMSYDKTAVWKSEPQPIFYLKGRTVTDTRTGAAATNLSNPALIAYDYVTNTTYGMGRDSSKVPVSYINDTADLAETTNNNHLGNGTAGDYKESAAAIDLFAFNGAIITDNPKLSNINKILSSMRSHLPWIAGEYHLITEQTSETSVFSFDEDNLTGDFKVTETSADQKLNAVYYKIIDSRQGYRENVASEASSTYLSEDNGIENYETFSSYFETDFYRARQRANTILKGSREGIRVSFSCSNPSALNYVTAGCIVDITRTSQGWTNKLFRVISVTISMSGLISCDVAEYESDVYDWDVGSEITRPDDTTLPALGTVTAPTGITAASGSTHQLSQTDGSATNRIYVAFTASADLYTAGYEVQYRNDSDNWVKLPNLDDIDDVNFYIPTVDEGQIYDVRVRAYNSQGTLSTWNTLSVESSTHTVTGTQAIGRDQQLRGASAYENDSIYWHTYFDSLDNMTTTGNVAYSNGSMILSASTVNPATVLRQISKPITSTTWNKNRRFKIQFETLFYSNSSGASYIGNGLETGNNEFIGVYLAWNGGTSKVSIYATCRDGASATNTLITEVNDVTTNDLEVVFTSGTDAVFTINGGSETTITTNLPSGTSYAAYLLKVAMPVTTVGAANITFGEYKFLQEE